MRIKTILKLVLGMFAAALIFIAVFAVQLGIDANTEWGPSRKILLVSGFLLLAVALSVQIQHTFQLISKAIYKLFNNSYQAALGVPFIEGSLKATSIIIANGREHFSEHRAMIYLRRYFIEPSRRFKSRVADLPPVTYFRESKIRSARLMVAVLIFLITGLYVWLVSVGFITSWPRTTDYYALLGEAFLEGKTHLLVEPDPRLGQLSDPYEFEQRKAIPQLWDASFHDGKYFLYWGPVPGIVDAFAKGIFGVRLGDQHLTFLFDLGIVFFGSLILLRLYEKFFYDLPLWTLIPGVLLMGLANPLPWLLSRPAIYEAAIAGGQFFLLGGFYWALTAFGSDRIKPSRLVLAGIFWSLAVGSRTSVVFAVAVFSFFTLLRIVFLGKASSSKWTGIVRPTISLVIPLILGAALYSWYNFDRFGDILEFGHKYQLSRLNLYAMYESVISIAYAPPSAFDYLFNPFRSLRVFPYVKAIAGGHYIWPIHRILPKYYYTEAITGMTISTPYLLLAIIPIVVLIKQKPSFRSLGGGEVVPAAQPQNQLEFLWVIKTLVCVIISIFTPLLFFLATSMRHLTDVVPLLVILATLGMWIGFSRVRDNKSKHWVFTIVVWGVSLYSAAIGFLLSVTGYHARFETLNPDLFERITRLFTW